MSGTPAATQSQFPKRGAIPSPRSALAAAVPHVAAAAPSNFIVIPRQISFWGNYSNGDCVTAEEAFAKACNNPEIFISENEVIAWATSHNVLNGAYLTQVMQFMENGGFALDDSTYDDGPYFSVDWTNSAILQSAITMGPVKLGVAGDQLSTVWWNAGGNSAGGVSGWFATGFQVDNNEDHSVSLCGFGTLAWLAEQLHVQVPSGIDGTQQGYALFTWDSIGIIDQKSMLAITHEAWLRQPTTVALGNSSLIAAVGTDNSLQFYYQTIGTGPWNPEQVAGPGSTALASVAQVGNSSVIAAVGIDKSLKFYWQTVGTAPWNPEQVAGPNTTLSASVTQVGNSSVIAAVSTDNSLRFYYQTIGTAPWNPEQVAGPDTTASASVAQVGNSSVIAAVGTDNSLRFYYQTIGTGPWNPEQVAGPGTTASASVAQVGTSSVIAAVGTDKSLRFYYQTIGTGPWNPEEVCGPGTTLSASVAQVGNSSVIAAVGTDNSLLFYYQTIGTGSWNPQQVAGPGTTASASITRIGNASVIAAVGNDKTLRFYYQTIGTAPWNPEQVADSNTTLSASVA